MYSRGSVQARTGGQARTSAKAGGQARTGGAVLEQEVFLQIHNQTNE